MKDKKFTSDDRPSRLVDLAAELGFNPAGFLKVVRRRGFEPYKLQIGNNKPYYLSADDVNALRQKLEDEKYHRIVPEKEDVPSGISGVYAIEVPAYDCTVRIKFGWSESISDRLNTYRTIVPDLRVLRIWPCSANWYEQMTLTWAGNNGKRIGEEVFEIEDYEVAISSLDALFASLGIKSETTPL